MRVLKSCLLNLCTDLVNVLATKERRANEELYSIKQLLQSAMLDQTLVEGALGVLLNAKIKGVLNHELILSQVYRILSIALPYVTSTRAVKKLISTICTIF